METQSLLNNQNVNLEIIALNYMQSIIDNKEAFFRHPPIYLQLIDINSCLFSDSQFQMECKIPQRQKNWEKSLFFFRNWMFQIQFNPKTHFLSFEMQADQIELKGNMEQITARSPRLISTQDIKKKLELLRKHFMRKIFRETTNHKKLVNFKSQQDNSSYIKVEKNEKIKLYIPYEQNALIPPQQIQKQQPSMTKNLSKKITSNIQQKSFKFDENRQDLTQKKINKIYENSQFKQRFQKTEKSQLIKSLYNPNEYVDLSLDDEDNEIRDEEDEEYDMLRDNNVIVLREKKQKQITINSDNDDYYKRKPSIYPQLLLKLWQEKLKRRNKKLKYMPLSSSDERDNPQKISSDGTIQTKNQLIEIPEQESNEDETIKFTDAKKSKKFDKKRFYAQENGKSKFIDINIFEKRKNKNKKYQERLKSRLQKEQQILDEEYQQNLMELEQQYRYDEENESSIESDDEKSVKKEKFEEIKSKYLRQSIQVKEISESDSQKIVNKSKVDQKTQKFVNNIKKSSLLKILNKKANFQKQQLSESSNDVDSSEERIFLENYLKQKHKKKLQKKKYNDQYEFYQQQKDSDESSEGDQIQIQMIESNLQKKLKI